MAVHPAELTTGGAAIYTLSWPFISFEQLRVGKRRAAVWCGGGEDVWLPAAPLKPPV